jgi:hypothetical protein
MPARPAGVFCSVQPGSVVGESLFSLVTALHQKSERSISSGEAGLDRTS